MSDQVPMPPKKAGRCAPPCLWLRTAAGLVALAITLSLPIGWTRYRSLSDTQTDEKARVSDISARVKHLEDGSIAHTQALSQMTSEVASLRGESKAVLRTTERVLDEVQALRKEK
jgi:hypothetical protein